MSHGVSFGRWTGPPFAMLANHALLTTTTRLITLTYGGPFRQRIASIFGRELFPGDLAMNRRDFLKHTVAGTGLGALPGGICGLGGPAFGQQPPAAAEPRRAEMTLRRPPATACSSAPPSARQLGQTRADGAPRPAVHLRDGGERDEAHLFAPRTRDLQLWAGGPDRRLCHGPRPESHWPHALLAQSGSSVALSG